MTVIELLSRCRKVSRKRERGRAMTDNAVEELRDLWMEARELGVASHLVAEASRVSPTAVRMWWSETERTASQA